LVFFLSRVFFYIMEGRFLFFSPLCPPVKAQSLPFSNFTGPLFHPRVLKVFPFVLTFLPFLYSQVPSLLFPFLGFSSFSFCSPPISRVSTIVPSFLKIGNGSPPGRQPSSPPYSFFSNDRISFNYIMLVVFLLFFPPFFHAPKPLFHHVFFLAPLPFFPLSSPGIMIDYGIFFPFFSSSVERDPLSLLHTLPYPTDR